MILRELYYFDRKTLEPTEDNRYEPQDDESIVKIGDTRKTRLTLRDINKARRADDMHRQEADKDLSHISHVWTCSTSTSRSSVRINTCLKVISLAKQKNNVKLENAKKKIKQFLQRQ